MTRTRGLNATARAWAVTTWPVTPEDDPTAREGYDVAYRRFHTWVPHVSPTTGRLHQHHYYVASQPIRLSCIQRMFGRKIKAKPVVYEPRYFKYIQQDDPEEQQLHGVAGPWEQAGSLVSFQGMRTDCLHARQMAKEGHTAKEIRDEVPSMYRFSRAVELMVEDNRTIPRTRPLVVYLIWGPPNCGKTTRALQRFPDAYLTSGAQSMSSFQDYANQKAVIMDGWLHSQWQFTDMESYVKGFVVPINIKYGRVHSLWETLVITTNQHPDSIYASQFNRSAFQARLAHVIYWNGALEDEFPWP